MSGEFFHCAGYHGTSIDNARRIEEVGFYRSKHGVFFAPMDNLYLAKIYGRNRAEELGDATYGIIEATFPTQKIKFGLGGNHEIRIPSEEICGIIVHSVLEFDILPVHNVVSRSVATSELPL